MNNDDNLIENKDSIITEDEPKIGDDEQNELNLIQNHLNNMQQNNSQLGKITPELYANQNNDDDDRDNSEEGDPKPRKKSIEPAEENNYEEYGFMDVFQDQNPRVYEDDDGEPGVIEQYEPSF